MDAATMAMKGNTRTLEDLSIGILRELAEAGSWSVTALESIGRLNWRFAGPVVF
jgi:hypothetical protein